MSISAAARMMADWSCLRRYVLGVHSFVPSTNTPRTNADERGGFAISIVPKSSHPNETHLKVQAMRRRASVRGIVTVKQLPQLRFTLRLRTVGPISFSAGAKTDRLHTPMATTMHSSFGSFFGRTSIWPTQINRRRRRGGGWIMDSARKASTRLKFSRVAMRALTLNQHWETYPKYPCAKLPPGN